MKNSATENKIHIVDNKTGFCSTCNKYELDKVKNDKYIKYGEIKTDSDIKQTVEPHETVSENTLTNLEDQQIIKYKRIKCFDCCKGKLAEKYKICVLCDSLHYVPLWCVLLISSVIAAEYAAVGYLSYFYLKLNYTSAYTGPCNSFASCDTSKGLICQTGNSSSSYCNCPAYVSINTCDCPSTYFWSGVMCTPVLGYNEGPCSGDYSCTKGLTCNQYTSKCSCSDFKPIWNSKYRTCNYNYLGCFNMSSDEFATTDFVLQYTSPSYVELDSCLLYCNFTQRKYASLVYVHTLQVRCACSDTYSKNSTSISNTVCSNPCSVAVNSNLNLCTSTNNTYSSFQIGST